MSKFKNCKVCSAKTDKVNDTFELVQCENCKLVFSENIFTQEEFVAVYDDLYNKDASAYQRHSKNEFDKIKQGDIKVGKNRGALINKNIIKGNCKSVLEIGSGIGLVGSYVKVKAPQIAYKGIELDKEAFLKSQELGLDTYNGDFTIMQNFEESFDVIMLWEVVEHLQDLKQFLDLAYAKLNHGGTLILSTPNYDKIKNYPHGKKDTLYQNEPPIHLNFFTKSNLGNVMETSGFEKCTIRIKKFPYFEKNISRLIKNYTKAIFRKYNGPTLYLEAKKL
jgi:2-polyprenyl-3-methyl-5-hydroxy-6-metoxy-1,4-benzoquinol methylase